MRPRPWREGGRRELYSVNLLQFYFAVSGFLWNLPPLSDDPGTSLLLATSTGDARWSMTGFNLHC